MLTVCTLLWDANARSHDFSRHYTEADVEKLYRGFKRHLTRPFQFVCFTDREREFSEPVAQVRISAETPDYGTCIEPYRMGVPMILAGLDTVVTGNCDHLADWCMVERDCIALPRDPYKPHIACNGVALVPGGMERIGFEHDGANDMEHVRRYPHVFMDDEWPGHVVSYKGAVKRNGLGDARIVYFHGQEKPHQLAGVGWIEREWV